MTCSVQVPASSANLGPAFDCAAVALNLYLRATATRTDRGCEVRYRGANEDRVTLDESNLIVRAIRNFANAAKAELGGLRLEVENQIPIGVGLGSSAAAIIAGTLLGAEICGVKCEPAVLLRRALLLENHPDNISAALYGGLVVAATVGGGAEDGADVMVRRTDVSQKLDFVAVTPDRPLSTEKARAVLPAQYSRQDLARNLQRAALLTASFFSGGELSPELFRDRVHQPYRSPLVPGIAACLEYRHDGLAGIFLSGAGSSVMAIAKHSAGEIGDALVKKFRSEGVNASARVLKADNRGAHVVAAQ
ncbi:MAG: homoserine kinase [Candidatus Acidiferrales bacterium]